jgi:hypothetical protein
MQRWRWWVITVARIQSLVVRKRHDHSIQISQQGPAVLPFGFALEVPFVHLRLQKISCVSLSGK